MIKLHAMLPTRKKAKCLILFSDVSGSTGLYEFLGDRKALHLIDRVLRLLAQCATKWRGRILKTIGDEIMCAFSVPEDAVHSACAMHQSIETDAVLTKHHIAIKTGMHFGEVISEEGDIFGDTVNTAARMVSLAKPRQILITGEALLQTSPELRSRSRPLGQVKVHGKKALIDIAEIFWQEDFSDLTFVPGMIKDERPPRSALILCHQGKEYTLRDETGTIKIGRNDQNDIVVKSDLVSRMHASINYRQGNFFFIDHSANGTFISTEHDEIAFLHRDTIRLHGKGKISLGLRFSADPESVIFFAHQPIRYD